MSGVPLGHVGLFLLVILVYAIWPFWSFVPICWGWSFSGCVTMSLSKIPWSESCGLLSVNLLLSRGGYIICPRHFRTVSLDMGSIVSYSSLFFFLFFYFCLRPLFVCICYVYIYISRTIAASLVFVWGGMIGLLPGVTGWGYQLLYAIGHEKWDAFTKSALSDLVFFFVLFYGWILRNVGWCRKNNRSPMNAEMMSPVVGVCIFIYIFFFCVRRLAALFSPLLEGG